MFRIAHLEVLRLYHDDPVGLDPKLVAEMNTQSKTFDSSSQANQSARQPNRQTDNQTTRQTANRQTARQPDRQTANRQTARQTDRQTANRQTDRQPDRQTDRQAPVSHRTAEHEPSHPSPAYPRRSPAISHSSPHGSPRSKHERVGLRSTAEVTAMVVSAPHSSHH